MTLPKADAAILSTRWAEGVLLKRDVFSSVERGHFRDETGDADAVLRRIDQVRDYRNWVAHGRRDAPTNNVTPELAYARLNEFLAALGIASESEEESPRSSDEIPE